MKRLGLILALSLVLPSAGQAQGNDDDFTPLGSRIKRDRQFPTELPHRFGKEQYSKVNRDRSKAMLGQFTQCLYRRSNEASLDLLKKTDISFVDFQQIGLNQERALRIYGFSDCLGRVAESNGSGVVLRFAPGSLRQWLLQEAYFSRYPESASWVKPGNVIGERVYPLRGNAGGDVLVEFADCAVQADPYGADYFFRSSPGSGEEKNALNSLIPVLGPCLPQGLKMELSPASLRVWLGEALWHGANNSAPATDTSEVVQ